jgi:hypothetical protein
MGGAASPKGIQLIFHDAAGNVDATRPAITQAFVHLTGQPQGQPGVGSADWLKEVYLAADPQGIYTLMRSYPPSGTTPPLTSAVSKQVTVNYYDAESQMHSETWTTALALGTDTSITKADGTTESVRLFETLRVTQGDAVADATNALNLEVTDPKNTTAKAPDPVGL